MKEQLISFETAFAAKEKGFPQNKTLRDSYYNFEGELNGDVTKYLQSTFWKEKDNIKKFSNVAAPTQSLFQKWLREKHNLVVLITYPHTNTNRVEGINSVMFNIEIYTLKGGDALKTYTFIKFTDNYEQALEAGLNRALKLIK